MYFYNYYQKMLKEHPLISNDQVLSILKNKPKSVALNEVFLGNSMLVYYEVRRWTLTARKLGVDPMDFIQAGSLGLWLWTLKFDVRKSPNYRGIARRYIRSYIEAEIFKNSILSRYSWKKHYRGNSIGLNPVDSLDAPVYENENGDSILLEETITTDELPNDIVAAKSIIRKVLHLLNTANGTLPPFATKIITLRFGIGARLGWGPMSCAEVSDHLENKLCKERVRQIEKQTLKYLRKNWNQT